jgi:hypothetical protein
MEMADVREALASGLRSRKVFLQLPTGYGDGASAEVGPRRIEFSRDEFLGLYDVHDQIADILLKSFVERGVMHIDLLKEDVARSVASMKDVAAYLDQKLGELRGKLPPDQRGLIRILDMYRSNCVTHAKAIERLSREIEEGNRGEFDSEFNVRPSDWLPRPLREFRLSVYPLIRALIDALPDEDLVKERALQGWYEGRKILEESQKDQAIPRWLIERANASPEAAPEPESSLTPDSPGSHTVRPGTLASFLRGVGSVLEFYPPPERFDVWRVAQDIPLDEWPAAVRALLAEMQEDAASRGVPS